MVAHISLKKYFTVGLIFTALFAFAVLVFSDSPIGQRSIDTLRMIGYSILLLCTVGALPYFDSRIKIDIEAVSIGFVVRIPLSEIREVRLATPGQMYFEWSSSQGRRRSWRVNVTLFDSSTLKNFLAELSRRNHNIQFDSVARNLIDRSWCRTAE